MELLDQDDNKTAGHYLSLVSLIYYNRRNHNNKSLIWGDKLFVKRVHLYSSADLCFVIPLGCVSSLSPWWSSCNMLVGLLQGLLNMTEPSSSSSSSDWLTTVSKPLRESSESDSDRDRPIEMSKQEHQLFLKNKPRGKTKTLSEYRSQVN